MTPDPFLPFTVCPVSGDECFVVRGRLVGPFVEISLGREQRQTHPFRADSYTLVELLAVKRFRHHDVADREAYASRLEDAAKIAARGHLGYKVHTADENGALRVSLVARLLTADGRVQTEISDEHTFEDPDSAMALVEANEKAAELRAAATELNDEWVTRRNAHLQDLRAEYDQADAQAEAANELRQIVDSQDN